MEGYAVVRTAFKKEDGWRIGPVFANDSKIARNLYGAMIEKVAAQDRTPSITVNIPYGSCCDQETLGIAVELSGSIELMITRMYTKGVPLEMPLKKKFGVTTVEQLVSYCRSQEYYSILVFGTYLCCITVLVYTIESWLSVRSKQTAECY